MISKKIIHHILSYLTHFSEIQNCNAFTRFYRDNIQIIFNEFLFNIIHVAHVEFVNHKTARTSLIGHARYTFNSTDLLGYSTQTPGDGNSLYVSCFYRVYIYLFFCSSCNKELIACKSVHS